MIQLIAGYVWDADGISQVAYDVEPKAGQEQAVRDLEAAGFSHHEKEELYEGKTYSFLEADYPEVSDPMMAVGYADSYVVPFLGRHYRLSLHNASKMAQGLVEDQYRFKSVFQFEKTDEPVTLEPNAPDPLYRQQSRWLYWGGQPEFIQGHYAYTHDGKALHFMCRLETGHGDAGNVNVFAVVSDEGEPKRLVFEASCC